MVEMAKRFTTGMIKELTEDKHRALHKGRNAEAMDIAVALGDSTEEIEKLEAERVYFLEVKPRLESALVQPTKSKRASKNQTKYKALAELADNMGIDVDNIFADTEIKRSHLRRIMGYKSLRVGRGHDAFTGIDNAKPERIGEVYKNCYYSRH